MKDKDISARFVTMHYVDREYHQLHPQMLHRHDDVLELLYIIKGEGDYIVDGRNYNVSRGNLIICDQSVLHGQPYVSREQANTLESYCCVMTDLHLPGLPANVLAGEDQDPVLFFDFDRMPIEQILTALYDLYQNPELYNDACDGLANALLDIVYIKMQNQAESENLSKPNRKSSSYQSSKDFIRNVTKYLDEHFNEPVTLQQLEQEFHISSCYFSHLFKQKTGISPMRYVTRRRIGESQSLLMNSDMQIGEIGSLVGFEDNCHFSYVFKKYVGLTPSEYRQNFRKI